MYNFFYEKGKSRGTENQVRNRIIELFMWHDTNDIITANDIPFSSNSNKSFRAKIKSHLNKFLNYMEATTNYNNVKNRAMFMELFTRLLLDLPKNKFEHLVDFSQKSNYLYSFFDQRILSYFLKMDTCNRSRGTLYIKAMLYDMHRSQPEDFEALLSVMKNKDFLMAFKHFYLIAAFTIKRLFDHSLNNEYSRVSEKVKEHANLKVPEDKRIEQTDICLTPIKSKRKLIMPNRCRIHKKHKKLN